MDHDDYMMRAEALNAAVALRTNPVSNPQFAGADVLTTARDILAFLKGPETNPDPVFTPVKNGRAHDHKGGTAMGGLGADCATSAASISQQGYLALSALASTKGQTIPVYLDSEDARALLAAITKRDAG